ncbi:MAG: cysteine hydrolase [Spirochaetes bacterium]|nr:cysteine hydrolase [Spirochaetota bacterium]
MHRKKTALIIVDMQRYYLERESDYQIYFNAINPGCLDYITGHCRDTVIPNISMLISRFRKTGMPVVYLRLCGNREDRSDLHRFFRDTWERGVEAGLANVYPLESDPMSMVHDGISPGPDDIVIKKTTYSAFNSSDIKRTLDDAGIRVLVFTGLATSQCVETTARDSSDNGFDVIHISDAQADYTELSHNTSLYSSRGVCGGVIMTTDEFLGLFD